VSAAKEEEPTVDYEAVAARFEDALFEKLRQHSVENAFLEFWVPDADPLKGIVSMVDSARIAGFDRITIRFTNESVPAARVGELRERLGDIGAIEIDAATSGAVLRASDLREAAGRRAWSNPARRGRDYWRPGHTAVPAANGAASRNEPADLASDFGDVTLNYRAAMARILGAVTHEGTLENGAESVVVSAKEGAAFLSAEIDPGTHRIRRIRHRGAARPSERAVLECFCRLAEGLPIVEAADHVGLRVIDTLWQKAPGPAAPGIVLPSNQPAAFGVALRLGRALRDNYQAHTGFAERANFFYAKPGARWQAMSRAERLGSVIAALEPFLVSERRGPADMELHDIVKNRYGEEIRIVIAFARAVPADDRPGLMRRFEAHLRQTVEPELEVIAEMAKDQSPLRRLS